ncbi:MAG: UPF0149 family protein [Gammaproteobacteria bacterium]
MSEQMAAHLLVSAEGYDGAASHQGGFFALASASATDATQNWVTSVLNDWPADLRHEEHRATLVDAAGEWVTQLEVGELGFGLIIAGDDAPLAERADSLAQWCQGYLVGLAMAGVKDHNALPGDVPEFVNDLLKISQVAAEGDGNDDENAFYELCEYIRVGVQLVFDELAPIRQAQLNDSNKVH